FNRASSQVWREDDIRRFDERTIRGRLLFEDVEPGAGYLAAGQRVRQGSFVDDAAASNVEQPRAFRQHRQFARADEVLRVGQKRNVQCEKIALRQQLVSC